MLATNANLERRLNELERKYDSQFKVVFDAIRQLTASPEKQPKKIGFQLREKRAGYGRRCVTPRRQGRQGEKKIFGKGFLKNVILFMPQSIFAPFAPLREKDEFGSGA